MLIRFLMNWVSSEGVAILGILCCWQEHDLAVEKHCNDVNWRVCFQLCINMFCLLLIVILNHKRIIKKARVS